MLSARFHIFEETAITMRPTLCQLNCCLNARRHSSHSPVDIPRRQSRLLADAPMNQGQVPNNDDSSGIDRISELPDDIICHILSFLSTRFAVRTSVLSTRWKNLFPLIPNLKIELSDFKHQGSASETSQIIFKNFVDRLLNITLRSVPYVPSIYCFCLDCHKCNDGRKLAGWVNAALSLNIKRIHLCICGLTNSNILIDSLFGANIVNLTLSFSLGDFASEYRFSLPNLKELTVHRMKSKAVNTLLESCHSLTNLSLSYIDWDRGSVLRVCIPSLRFLELSDLLNSLEGSLVLDVPLLEGMRYVGFLPKSLLVKKLKLLKEAHLDFFEIFNMFNEQADVLIEACSNAEKLWMSEKVLRMLHRLPRPLIRFQRLFDLQVPMIDAYGWQVLPSFLDSAPNLKKLVAKSGFVYGRYWRFVVSLREPLSICLTNYGGTGFCLEFHKLKPHL